jgi:hypothetical protein
VLQIKECVGHNENVTFWDARKTAVSDEPNQWVLPKRMFLQNPHGTTSQKTTFFSHRYGNLES